MSFIKKIRIRNFKALEDITLDVKSLNFLFGPNSAGKSSSIKAILFLVKNLFPLNSGNTIYKLNNETDLVGYSDIVSDNDIAKEIIIDFALYGKYYFDKNPFTKKIADNSYFAEHYVSDVESRKNELIEKYNEYCFDINISFRFTGENHYGKLSQIEITDKIENCILKFSNNSVFNNRIKTPFWTYEGSYPESSEFLLFAGMLVNELNTNISNTPFDVVPIMDYSRIQRFEGAVLNDQSDVNEIELSSYRKDAARLYYLYYIVLPNILKLSLSGYHLPTIRKIPSKKFYLDDDGSFKQTDYYDYLNEMSLHQNSLIDFSSNDNTVKPFEKEYFNNYYKFYNLLMGLKSEISLAISEYFIEKDGNTVKKIVDDNLYEKYLFNLFWVFEELEAVSNIVTYDDLLAFFHNNKLSESRKYSELKIFNKLKPESAKLLYSLFVHNPSIRSKRKYLFGDDNRIPNFNYNLSVLINSALKKLGFDSFLIVNKTDETGSLISLKNNLTKINIANESSGLLQILPVLFGLVFIKSYLFVDVPSVKDKSTDIFTDVFEYIYPSLEYQGMYEVKTSLLLEQPELHLHPRLQCRLAVYISEIIKSFSPFNYLFIETHSEHIIRMMQLLVAQNKVSLSDISISYFDNSGGKVVVRNLRLSENGNFLDPWPDGFFDEASELTFELLKAQMNRNN